MPAALEYHTFSLNPDQFLSAEGQPDHGLAINSASNRNTDMEENQSFQK